MAFFGWINLSELVFQLIKVQKLVQEKPLIPIQWRLKPSAYFSELVGILLQNRSVRAIVKKSFRHDVKKGRAKSLLLSKRATPSIDLLHAQTQQTAQAVFSRIQQTGGGSTRRQARREGGRAVV